MNKISDFPVIVDNCYKEVANFKKKEELGEAISQTKEEKKMVKKEEINDKAPVIGDYENAVRLGNPGGGLNLESSRVFIEPFGNPYLVG